MQIFLSRTPSIRSDSESVATVAQYCALLNLHTYLSRAGPVVQGAPVEVQAPGTEAAGTGGALLNSASSSASSCNLVFLTNSSFPFSVFLLPNSNLLSPPRTSNKISASFLFPVLLKLLGNTIIPLSNLENVLQQQKWNGQWKRHLNSRRPCYAVRTVPTTPKKIPSLFSDILRKIFFYWRSPTCCSLSAQALAAEEHETSWPTQRNKFRIRVVLDEQMRQWVEKTKYAAGKRNWYTLDRFHIEYI